VYEDGDEEDLEKWEILGGFGLYRQRNRHSRLCETLPSAPFVDREPLPGEMVQVKLVDTYFNATVMRTPSCLVPIADSDDSDDSGAEDEGKKTRLCFLH
jgi:hypothetical protein